MKIYSDKVRANKSPSVANGLVQKQSGIESAFQFTDNRPEATPQRKLQELVKSSQQTYQLKTFQNMANNSHHHNYLSQLPPLQMNRKMKRKKQGQEERVSVSRPSHSQEDIQDEMIRHWLRNPLNDQDQLRANYAWNYKGVEGGWCDGWSYVLSVDGDGLAELWEKIDSYLDGGEQLNSTDIYKACTFARKASLYHIMNQDPPTVKSPQGLDYQAANFDLEQTPSKRENWQHDEDSTLPMYVIKEDIKSLDAGQTLRLTSPIHDAAVKCIKGGYIVAETESHGIQKCKNLQEVLLILDEWRKECEQNNAPFFNQTMIV